MKKAIQLLIILVLLLGSFPMIAHASPSMVGINVILNQSVNDNILENLGA